MTFSPKLLALTITLLGHLLNTMIDPHEDIFILEKSLKSWFLNMFCFIQTNIKSPNQLTGTLFNQLLQYTIHECGT